MRRWGTFFAHNLASDTISLLKSNNWLLDLCLSHRLHKRYVLKKVNQFLNILLVNFV
jgi:hypothetical protein